MCQRCPSALSKENAFRASYDNSCNSSSARSQVGGRVGNIKFLLPCDIARTSTFTTVLSGCQRLFRVSCYHWLPRLPLCKICHCLCWCLQEEEKKEHLCKNRPYFYEIDICVVPFLSLGSEGARWHSCWGASTHSVMWFQGAAFSMMSVTPRVENGVLLQETHWSQRRRHFNCIRLLQ